MFTGIIEAVGTIARFDHQGGDARMMIQSGKLALNDVCLGDSIAVNGVCLTVVELQDSGFLADVSAETLALTTLGKLNTGDQVNLEKALTPTTRLGGHLVSGHVDGVGEVLSRQIDARSVRFSIQAPAELAKYIAKKGSICVDGISLTINEINGALFELNIVPHTLQETTMDRFQPGRAVNLEVDLLARYMERLLMGEKAAQPHDQGVTEAFLAKHGFKR